VHNTTGAAEHDSAAKHPGMPHWRAGRPNRAEETIATKH